MFYLKANQAEFNWLIFVPKVSTPWHSLIDPLSGGIDIKMVSEKSHISFMIYCLRCQLFCALWSRVLTEKKLGFSSYAFGFCVFFRGKKCRRKAKDDSSNSH